MKKRLTKHDQNKTEDIMEDLGTLCRDSERTDDIDTILRKVREKYRMEVAYLSEFVGNSAVFRHVSAPGLEGLAKAGMSMDLREVYCLHILKGDLPNLMTDTGNFELAREIPITTAIPIGSHMSVPVERADGSNYGMLCCLARHTSPELGAPDLEEFRGYAERVRALIH
ncbi:hypothetical protein [Histidinibacterium aquaticum]|uniref:GAF domain-containing protein n=1 Tax=Histidinibacterium aquaticum TaxID=2613962 RepID=A0A5J5GNE4_9RHOB|nr:hypothetical protein [Histidinibacterium aquaticum]KAA9009906.1 hypothetical protein F3S47_01160 [Histidinibacterium aquaticum]